MHEHESRSSLHVHRRRGNMNQIVFVVTFCFAVAALVAGDEECKKKMAAAITKCKTDMKLADADVDVWMKNPPYPDTLNKCVPKCVAEQLGLFSEGKIVETKAKEIIEKMNMKSKDNKENKEMVIYNLCKDVASKDPNLKDPVKDACEIASKIYTCIRENALKIGFSPA